MIHYDPVEFYGTIHTKSSGHSYARFNELALHKGDIISVEYVNDVMPYVSRPINDFNLDNEKIVPLEVFPITFASLFRFSTVYCFSCCVKVNIPAKTISMINIASKILIIFFIVILNIFIINRI